MNATAAAKVTVKRAARFNTWAAVFILAALVVYAVKAQTERSAVPSRHFSQFHVSSCETSPAFKSWLPCERRPDN